MAINLADKLGECDMASRRLASGVPNQPVGGSIAVQAEGVKQIQEYQRIAAACQTISGDLQHLRLRLLDVARENGVVGAAVESFALGSRRPEVLEAAVSDATAGDIKSLTFVSMHKSATFWMSVDAQQVARYALILAAKDSTVGALVRPYLDMAESLSVPLGGESQPKFDYSGLGSASRDEGVAIANRVINRVKAPK